MNLAWTGPNKAQAGAWAHVPGWPLVAFLMVAWARADDWSRAWWSFGHMSCGCLGSRWPLVVHLVAVGRAFRSLACGLVERKGLTKGKGEKREDRGREKKKERKEWGREKENKKRKEKKIYGVSDFRVFGF